MGIVFEKGINDMPRGWYSASENNKRVYQVWKGMLERCYSKKWHEKYPTYVNCILQLEWHWLSKFVEDIVKIEGYEYWLNNPNQGIALDKDIKSNGTNKCYCLEQCQFVDKSTNTRQSNKIMNYDFKKGQLIARYNKTTGKLIDVKYQFQYVIENKFTASKISDCCNGRRKSHKGYIFKYHETEE